MKKHTGGLALMAAVALMSAPLRAEDEDAKKAQKDILALAETLEKGSDGKSAVAAIKKKYEELNSIMHVYKPSTKGGVGVGAKGANDGIERKIALLARTELSKAKLDKEKAALLKMAYLNLAVGKVAHAYAPQKSKPGKPGTKEWNGYAGEQEKASKDLLDAIKKGKTADIKKHALSLNAACTNCHSDFRN